MAKTIEKSSKKRRRDQDEAGATVEAEAKSRKVKKSKKDKTSSSDPFLAADSKAFDASLSSLFANSVTGLSKPNLEPVEPPSRSRSKSKPDTSGDESDTVTEDGEPIVTEAAATIDADQDVSSAVPEIDEAIDKAGTRKRKRKDKHDDLEEAYMQRLAREEAKDAAAAKKERSEKRHASLGDIEGQEDEADSTAAGSDDDQVDDGSDEDDTNSPPPQHETLMPDTDSDLAKSQRTAFLANVSTEAITSKSALKTLRSHLSSFFASLPEPASGQPAHAIESIRFRSTAYASAIPKKAAFAKKELMEATTKSTNAYVVYSSTALVREAARKLNGTIVLNRHLRVDEVAHPAKTDHRRCVFIGNLGFVDDESNIDEANAAEGREKRRGKKEPGDVEEGLWRTFGKCGTVESVRVIRDSKTRVGKGIAYVQFTDENGVEAALQYNDQRFPPLLPRKLRVTRAKAIKRNAKPGSSATRTPQHTKGAGSGYKVKLTAEQQSQLGRAGKLMGRAAAAQMKSDNPNKQALGARVPGVRAPESFVFEGHRATSKSGKSGLKLGGSGKKAGKPRTRSTKRAAAWKAGGSKKSK